MKSKLVEVLILIIISVYYYSYNRRHTNHPHSTILVLNIKKFVWRSLSRAKNSHINQRISEREKKSLYSLLYAKIFRTT
jgi:hypothetical protein